MYVCNSCLAPEDINIQIKLTFSILHAFKLARNAIRSPRLEFGGIGKTISISFSVKDLNEFMSRPRSEKYHTNNTLDQNWRLLGSWDLLT